MIASNIVSNVPFVLVAVAWVPQMHDPTWGYVMLAVASTLAGNLTLFGSVANIIVMESAGPRGEIRQQNLALFPQIVVAPAIVAVIWQSLFQRHAPLDADEMLRVHLDLIFGERRTT